MMVFRLYSSNNKGFSIVDDEEWENVIDYNWRVNPRDYMERSSTLEEQSKGLPKTIYLHRQIMGFPQKMQIDHINGNKLDNRKENLRIVTNRQNHYNMGKRSGGTSKYKGVHWSKKDKKWISKIVVDGQQIRLGYFKNEVEAALIYNQASIKYHGQYAKLNDIEGELG